MIDKVYNKQKGFSMVEIVIASSIITLVLAVVVLTVSTFLKHSTNTTAEVKAGYLLEEGAEALKVLRDSSWDAYILTLSNTVPYYLHWNNSTWVATTSTSTIDSIFYRTFVLSAVYRDGNDDIASSGTLDTDTRKATVSVSWFDPRQNATTTKSLLLYITNLFDN